METVPVNEKQHKKYSGGRAVVGCMSNQQNHLIRWVIEDIKSKLMKRYQLEIVPFISAPATHQGKLWGFEVTDAPTL